MIAEMLPKLQLQILQHSLGCDEFGRGAMYRNHFVTGETGADGIACLQLVALGLMVNRGSRGALTGGSSLFHVTDEGKAVMRSQSPPVLVPKKISRGEQRYLDWIQADSGVSFAEWIGIKPKRKVW